MPTDDLFAQAPAGPFALDTPSPGRLARVAGLPGCAEAMALAALARTRRVVVLARDTASAVRLAEQLEYLADGVVVHHLVGWEVLPYDATSPPRSTVGARIAALADLHRGRPGVYVSAGADALLPCMPPAVLGGQALQLRVGDELDVGRLAAELVAAGCANVDRVRAPGEFSVYGGQVDLYPGGALQPYRLVLELDEIGQIRTFDPATQLSTGKTAAIESLPAREYPLDDPAIVQFRQRWREHFGAADDSDVYGAISAGEQAEGAEFYLPLFYGTRASLFDYLRPSDVVWMHHDLRANLEGFTALAAERHARAASRGLPVLAPDRLFVQAEEFYARVKAQPAFELYDKTGPGTRDLGARALDSLAPSRGAARPYAKLGGWLAGQTGAVVFAWQGAARRLRVERALEAVGASAADAQSLDDCGAGTWLLEAPLTGGFSQAKSGLTVVTEAELHNYVPAPRLLRPAATAVQTMLGDLNPGELVVHQDHGVARFSGLEVKHTGEAEQEFIALEFADQVRLYVAVSQCHLVSRHRQPEAGEEIELHKLGGKRWTKTRTRAEKAARDSAAYLLDIYARRAAAPKKPRARFSEADYGRFCEAFPYAETADQMRATAEVVADMASDRLMDRLLCGDVGFGKTEVAMRAAWVAHAAGRQVAVVAPTTLLADQLCRVFEERFSGTGAVISALSSLQSKRECDEVIAQVAAGEIDIVIGTHSLLGAQVRIPRLGLVIIDEEHRFGVRQKEKLRALRAQTDVLALSATPIPRTLSMALDGLRDMSLIATSPADRLEVRTFVTDDDDALVREALARELARGGQAFYVHHRVQTIGWAFDRVVDLAPSATVGQVHGQMPHSQLEAEMRRFYRGETDVLVCTTIIESGIDVANANTMIIGRADMYGLAQLHQLRGRVGRSSRQAYVYCLAPPTTAQDGKARARLASLVAATRRGGGYYIAVRDLEIRGAGELLGEAQSGVVAAVGVEAFKRMIATAARVARNDGTVAQTEIDFGSEPQLPSEYCANAVERMRMYRRLADAATAAELDGIDAEMLDRFGAPPAAARLLVDCHRLRLLAGELGIVRLQATSSGLRLQLGANPPCAAGLVELMQQRSDCVATAPDSLRVDCAGDLADQAQLAFELCAELAGPAKARRRAAT